MNTVQTEEFAKVCKELSTYFFSLAPEPHTYQSSEGYEESYIGSFDKLKKPENSSKFPKPPYNLEYFRQYYLEFNNETKENIKISDIGFVNKLIKHFLDNCLPYEKLLPVEEQFFRERLFDEAELLYNFKLISREINQKYGSISLIGDPLPF
ncbi:MAG: hypothetical protein JXQ69_06265 [Paludibacteraceae bacterium]|nr:hypothetical protein [Paludibacteraceae bacterium]MBN2787914.1 hypothetical protein [Paludibacteraceae bacterium]